MARRKGDLGKLSAGLLLLFIGVVLCVCTLPVFSYTREGSEQIRKTETIMNYSFNIHQYQDKMVEFQAKIGQTLNLSAQGSGTFNFSIANFTRTNQTIRPDQPDITYLYQNNISAINTTWSPPTRVAEAGSYYLIFLARNASIDSPVQIYANVTKTWIEIQLKPVVAPDRRPLLDQNFVYVGSVMIVLGTLISSVTFSRMRRPVSHRRQ